jgi:hypothetical protein
VERQRVVAFFVTSVFGVFTREAEKIAKESRSEKIAAGESGAVRVRPHP